MPPRSDLYSSVEPFGRPRRSRAVAELLETFVPYVALNVVMVMAVRGGHPVVALALTGLAAGFLVRLFIIFHDCCHGSFFPSRHANRIVGYAAGLLTLTPFDKWQRSHAEHHATAGDLDRRGVGDVWTLTTREYRRRRRRSDSSTACSETHSSCSAWARRSCSCAATECVGPGASRRERFSVHFTNAGLVAALLVAHLDDRVADADVDTNAHAFCLPARSGCGCFTCNTNSKTRTGRVVEHGNRCGRRWREVPTTSCRRCCSGSRAASACITSTTSSPASRPTTCNRARTPSGVPGGAAIDDAPQPGLAAPASGGRNRSTHGQLGGGQRGWRQTSSRSNADES